MGSTVNSNEILHLATLSDNPFGARTMRGAIIKKKAKGVIYCVWGVVYSGD